MLIQAVPLIDDAFGIAPERAVPNLTVPPPVVVVPAPTIIPVVIPAPAIVPVVIPAPVVVPVVVPPVVPIVGYRRTR